jgi:ankyrin repeat protein
MLKIMFGQLRFVLTCLLQFGCTPLHYACERGHAEVVTVLLSAGARIEAQSQVRSEGMRVVIISFVFRMDGLPFTSLVVMVLWDWSLSCWQQELKSMLEMRFGQLRFVLTCLLQYRRTPLHRACSGGHAEVVAVLLSAGARIESQTTVRSEGRTVVISSLSFLFLLPAHSRVNPLLIWFARGRGKGELCFV